jgi:hypothetical protein
MKSKSGQLVDESIWLRIAVNDVIYAIQNTSDRRILDSLASVSSHRTIAQGILSEISNSSTDDIAVICPICDYVQEENRPDTDRLQWTCRQCCNKVEDDISHNSQNLKRFIELYGGPILGGR